LNVIEDGTADVIKGGEVIASLGPGEVGGQLRSLVEQRQELNEGHATPR